MNIPKSFSIQPFFKTLDWHNGSPSFGRRVALVGVGVLTIPALLIEGVARLALAILGEAASLATLRNKKVVDFTKEMGSSGIINIAHSILVVKRLINPVPEY